MFHGQSIPQHMKTETFWLNEWICDLWDLPYFLCLYFSWSIKRITLYWISFPVRCCFFRAWLHLLSFVNSPSSIIPQVHGLNSRIRSGYLVNNCFQAKTAVVPTSLFMNGSSYTFLGFLTRYMDILSVAQVISGSHTQWPSNWWISIY